MLCGHAIALERSLPHGLGMEIRWLNGVIGQVLVFNLIFEA